MADPSDRPRVPATPRLCEGWVMRVRCLEIILLAFVLSGGSISEPAMSTAQDGTPSPSVETEAGRNDAPVPVELPRDDAPHDVGIEWWYYTGHLFTESGDRYGFEYVIFK